MNRCRNCGGTALKELGFAGVVAPFFLKRVFGMQLGASTSPTRLKRLVRTVVAFPQRWLERLNRPAVLMEMQSCEECSFIQSKLPFEEGAINRLYADYRSESYNLERIAYEPGYARIARSVGQHAKELDVRVTAATKFILASISPDGDFSILDYGGADGKFLPRIKGKKYVFEISDVEPIEGITRLRCEDEIGTYSMVQLSHVLEHVVEPLKLVEHVAAKVAKGGYLYLEVPEELSESQRKALLSGGGSIGIHEHINSYCARAVTRLIESSGLKLVAIETSRVDVGWGIAVHIRALGMREAA